MVGSLGNGSYANVFEVYFRQAPMAVKVLNLSRPGSSGVSEETLRHFKYALPQDWTLSCTRLPLHDTGPAACATIRLCRLCCDLHCGQFSGMRLQLP